MQKIRVMVVDDSALMRKLISDILMKDLELDVVTTAMDGLFALQKIQKFRPDVITLDLAMPRMDGLTALRYIVNDYRLPVVLVSSLTPAGGHLTLEGLAAGAVDFVTKPQYAVSVHFQEVAQELIQKVKTASRIMPRQTSQPPSGKRSRISPLSLVSVQAPPKKIIAIGISTGGPNALTWMLSRLPGDFRGSIVIVQHMPGGFTEMFANRLNQACEICVKEAKEGDLLAAGTALIAPGNRHLKVLRTGMQGAAVLSSGPQLNGHRPSADILFDTVSQEYGPDAIGIVMTGMGEDGARGLGRIKNSGGYTIAQDEESCVVYGMPKAAKEMGNVHEVLSLEAIPERLMALLNEPSLATKPLS